MAIYVNGTAGWIGCYLWPILSKMEARRITRSPKRGELYCDLRSLSDNDGNWFKKGDIFIFLAAWSKPDQCAKEPEAAWLVNVENTCVLIERALKKDATVIFFSSDAVYGQQSGMLSENAVQLAVEKYGSMKAEVEKRFSLMPGFTALRLSYVVSGDDAVTRYLASCAEKNIVAEVFYQYRRNMVWIGDVVETVRVLTIMAQQGMTLPGIINVGGPACISRAQMALAYQNNFDKKLKYKEVEAPPDFFLARPHSICMDVSLMTSILKRQPFSIEDIYTNERNKSW